MHTRNGRGTRRRRTVRGFTLIELMVSFSALLIVMLGFSRMLLSSHMASSTTHEATLAKEAARSMVEQLQAMPLTDVYPTYKASQEASGFEVLGLDAPLDDADGRPGRILFPEQNGALSELVSKPPYGWGSIDMDRDGVCQSANVSATYKRLPVVVRVEWRGSGGDGSVEFTTVLGGL